MKFGKKSLPLSLTLFRLVSAGILFFMILSERKVASFFFFITIAFWSFFEFFIYRRWQSQIHSIIELLADKAMVTLTSFALFLLGLLPGWVVLVFLGRDFMTIVGGLYLLSQDMRREFKPTPIGKLTLFFQVIALIPILNGTLDWVLLWIAIGLTLASALELLFRSEFRPTRRTDLGEFFKLTGLVKVADIFTLLNAVFGLVAIFFVIRENYVYAAISLIIAVIADFFDGKLARRLGQQNEFGRELDSLADTISFGVAPAIFGFTLIQTPLALAAFTIFLFCGILRLARYNIMHMKENYEGMPITLNGIIIPAVYLSGVPIQAYPYIFLTLGVLMVSSIRVKKV